MAINKRILLLGLFLYYYSESGRCHHFSLNFTVVNTVRDTQHLASA